MYRRWKSRLQKATKVLIFIFMSAQPCICLPMKLNAKNIFDWVKKKKKSWHFLTSNIWLRYSVLSRSYRWIKCFNLNPCLNLDQSNHFIAYTWTFYNICQVKNRILLFFAPYHQITCISGSVLLSRRSPIGLLLIVVLHNLVNKQLRTKYSPYNIDCFQHTLFCICATCLLLVPF